MPSATYLLDELHAKLQSAFDLRAMGGGASAQNNGKLTLGKAVGAGLATAGGAWALNKFAGKGDKALATALANLIITNIPQEKLDKWGIDTGAKTEDKEKVETGTVEIPESKTEEKEKEEKADPIYDGEYGDIDVNGTDGTSEEGVIDIGGASFENDWRDWYMARRAEEWERDDQIRKEQQDRDDNAYQRAVEDMRKAGVNPNLIGTINTNYGTSTSNNVSGGDYSAGNATSEQANEITKYLGELSATMNKAGIDNKTATAIMSSIVDIIAAYIKADSTTSG